MIDHQQRHCEQRSPGSRLRIAALTVAMVLLASSAVGFARPEAAHADAVATVIFDGAGSAPRIGLIGDSAFAGIGVANTFEPMRSFNFVYDAVACRRTVLASCSIGGRPAPENAISVLRRLSGRWGSVLVMATGYNDPGRHFPEAVDAVMAEAARQGIPKVMWVTMRTAPVGFVPAGYRSTSSTFRDNNLILLQKADQYAGRLVIADWAGYSATHNEWFGSDGIHFRSTGAMEAAKFIANQSRRVLNGENITPTRAGGVAPSASWIYLRWGMGGTTVAEAQQRLIDEGVFVRGGVDGVFSVSTMYAVQTFQRRFGLHPTGIIDEKTAELLGLFSGAWSNVRFGASGPNVTRLQQALIDRGIFVKGGATGGFTIWTSYAVRTFQRIQGLPVTGVVDGATARALGLMAVPAASSIWTALSRGSTGQNVARAQQALMDRGVTVRGGADGVFSVWTYYAVNTFQRYNGLAVSGVIDVETARALGLFDLSSPVATWTDLRMGSAGSAVAAAERSLIAAGVNVRDGADGVFKIGDFYAVNTFQRYNGLAVSGVIDVRTARALGLFDLSSPVATWTNLRMGSAGSAVAAAERSLIAAGVNVRDGADGVFKIGDFYAVNTFQRYNGLSVTGEIDVATARRLGLFSQPVPSVAPLSVEAAAVTPTTTTTAPATTTTTTVTTSAPATTIGDTTTTSTAGAAGLAIRGRVWVDADRDGLQTAAEPGRPSVIVRLRGADGSALGLVITNSDGAFEFVDLPSGRYRLEADIPEDYALTAADRVVVSGNVDHDVVDSDFTVDVASGIAVTEPIPLTTDSVDNIGLGLVLIQLGTTTTDVSTSLPDVPESTDAPDTTDAPATTAASTSTSTTTPTTSTGAGTTTAPGTVSTDSPSTTE